MKINGATVVVTGASSGIGRATALYLASRGARIVAMGRDSERLQATLSQLLSSCPNKEHRCFCGDITDAEWVDQTFSLVKQEASIDVLVNSAGVNADQMLIKKNGDRFEKGLSLDAWDRVLNTNLKGTFICGQSAACLMAEQTSGGVIINLSSVASIGNIGQSNYSASKAGVIALTRAWAKELARYGIRTGAVSPGITRTPMTEKIPQKIMHKILEKIPLKRSARMEEVAQSVAFIIENDYFTGNTIDCDGGRNLA